MNFSSRCSKLFGGIFISILLLSSCVSNKKVIYLQDLGGSDALVSTTENFVYNAVEYKLQPNDIVDIQMTTTDENLNRLLQISGSDNVNAGMMGGQNGGDIFFINGYSLDEYGVVELPLIGEINLLGKDLKEAKIQIEEKLSKFVTAGNFFVRVRLGGIRFSALGEFNNPGKQAILQNRATIFEAIATAGDLNILAKRDEIVLIRQYPEGSKVHRLNLNDRNILNSEFYFIKPNDVLYAEPLKVREIGTGSNVLQTLTFLTTAISTIALIITLTRN
ncbi:sugar transporter [Algoriphagus sp. NBT04N3]|uniref:polysaccharide biosynthesis/export family protein n=1 Tax=Algoriphagus sp. NBT04N3 TaxID=2705473 RepID=UPI001C62ACDC|nr:polysaccharide biosynthesis/export family protein [Algoriphagus sp. NBT04N3]QYH37952.1 sugar transporter [Algoriphagus sp. NBT04N3]